MTDDMEDPVTRETMALEYMEGWWAYSPDFSPPPTMDEVRQMLQVLDSFDPLRAMLPQIMEVVGWVAGAAMVQGDLAQMTDPHATHRLSPGAWLTIDTRSGVESTRRTRIAATLYEHLTRLRTLTTNEGGKDDGEE